MLSAGEVSGDLHASYLIRELKRLDPNLYLFGMGGRRMKEAGVEIRADVTPHSTIGFAEGIRHLPALLQTLAKLKKDLDREKPDALILIDYQGFNMLLARVAKKRGIKTIYYIAPQEWLWGTRKNLLKVVKTIDKIIAIYEREYQVYRDNGAAVSYFGNPLLDIVRPSLPPEEARRQFGIANGQSVVSLFPGSRDHEIRQLLPILLKVAERLKREVKTLQFILPVSSPVFREQIERRLRNCSPEIKLVENQSQEVINLSDLMIAASGTVAMEAAIIGTPAILIYKFSPVTHFIGRKILRIKVPYFSMPNILLGKELFPEFEQKEVKPRLIAEAALTILRNEEKQAKMKEELARLRTLLGSPGAVSRAAQEIFKEIYGSLS